mgnify:CR=1 FL=1
MSLEIGFLFAVIAAMAYGALVGSYWGMAPPPGHILASIAIIDLRSHEDMMRLTVCIGAAHVLLTSAMSAWNSRASLAATGASRCRRPEPSR